MKATSNHVTTVSPFRYIKMQQLRNRQRFPYIPQYSTEADRQGIFFIPLIKIISCFCRAIHMNCMSKILGVAKITYLRTYGGAEGGCSSGT